jgi:Arc/MetJ-type ribon-helix-helix transcriptional regulator
MITVRMPDDRAAQIDGLVAAGVYPSRASVIIEAINRLVDEIEQREIDRQIVDAYERIPQTDDELRWSEAAGLDSIREEPW